MSNKISFSCSESVDVDVDVSFAVVCAKCNSPLESEYNQRTGTLFVSNCNKCTRSAVIWGLVALLADYVHMGREYGDMMNSDAKNMKAKIAELEGALKKIAVMEAEEHEPDFEMRGCMNSESCATCDEMIYIAREALKGSGNGNKTI